MLAEVTRYARRHPVTFLALCGLAGVVAGRLTRGAVAANTSLDSTDPDHRSPTRTPSWTDSKHRFLRDAARRTRKINMASTSDTRTAAPARIIAATIAMMLLLSAATYRLGR